MKEGLRSRTKGDSPNGDDGPRKADGAIATGVDQPLSIKRTDHSLWRLKVEHGRQTWHYITPEEAKTWLQSIPEKYHIGMETVTSFTQLQLTLRVFPTSLVPKRSVKQLAMAYHSIPLYKRKMDIGPVNMAAQCSFSPASYAQCT